VQSTVPRARDRGRRGLILCGCIPSFGAGVIIACATGSSALRPGQTRRR